MERYYIAFEQWLSGTKGRADLTIKTYLSALNEFERWAKGTFGDDFDVEKVSSLDLQDYRRYLIAKKTESGERMSPITVNKKIEALRSFFRFMVDQRRMTVNPAESLNRLKVQNQTEPRWLTRNERNALTRYFKEEEAHTKNLWLFRRNHAIVMTMLLAGLRVSEIVNLEFTDVDIAPSGKQMIYVYNSKGGKSRLIPVNKELRSVLLDWCEVRSQKGEGTQFFRSQRASDKLSVQGIEHLFRKLRKATGIAELTPHTLRHTFCHDLLSRGKPLPVVADLAGHSDINVTRLYVKSSEEERRDAVEAISGI